MPLSLRDVDNDDFALSLGVVRPQEGTGEPTRVQLEHTGQLPFLTFNLKVSIYKL